MTLTPDQFVAKWQGIEQKETAVYQTHFNDICALVGHDDPITSDPSGDFFSFETSTTKPDGRKGRADVYYRGKFIWEYKGPHANLDKAYQQLLLYREELGNPPLLITSDIHTIIIHTNFTNRPKETHEISFQRLQEGDGLDLLQRVFYNPESFQPQRTKQAITKASADTFVTVADALKQHRGLMGETHTDEQLAHFLVRLLFCLFAEDLRLLPNNIFTKIVQAQGRNYINLQQPLENLFRAMRDGGMFGLDPIRYFDGSLFDDAFVPSIPDDLGRALLRVADQDWSAIDPAIFGTLFERIIDESKRAQLGAHYTSQDDINLIVEPVLMEPLRQEWHEVRRACVRQPADAPEKLQAFSDKLAATRVLDPACGSGNFLYVALQKLLDLQKEVIVFAERNGHPPLDLTVSPEQLYGLEINPYAHELAQVTAWIGYLQWRAQNGFEEMDDPVLRPLRNIQRMDAILAYDEDGQPVEPAWPLADVIIGNPPFLGAKKILGELPEDYVHDLRQVYEGRLPNFSDFVTYWFERARKEIQHNRAGKVCLIATNSIAMGTNLTVLKRIKETGDIFLAWDDRPWILDGAAVRVAIVGYDDGSIVLKKLNDVEVGAINADLTAGVDVTQSVRLEENKNKSFIGTQKSGAFDINYKFAQEMLRDRNASGYLNSDVIVPWVNGSDIVRRPRNMYIIDFPSEMPIEEAQKYEWPFKYVKKEVKPKRTAKHFKDYPFWLHWNTRPGMRSAIANLDRYIATPRNAKHRVFVWLNGRTNPDSQVVVFASDDDYYFGVLHSLIHEVWTLSTCTWLGKGNDPRYTPRATFETFPFPWPPGEEPVGSSLVNAIATAAYNLNAWREAWLNPPPPQAGTINVAYDKMLKKRTLTNLYNGLVYYREHPGPAFNEPDFNKTTRRAVTRSQIEELHDLHTILDQAVCDAYGWPHTILQDKEQILTNLLALNQQRATSD